MFPPVAKERLQGEEGPVTMGSFSLSESFRSEELSPKAITAEARWAEMRSRASSFWKLPVLVITLTWDFGTTASPRARGALPHHHHLTGGFRSETQKDSSSSTIWGMHSFHPRRENMPLFPGLLPHPSFRQGIP